MRKSLRGKILIFFFTTAILVLLFPKGESIESEVTLGSIWIKPDLIASKSFEISKYENQYKSEVKSALKFVYPVYFRNTEIERNQVANFNIFSDSLLNYLKTGKSNSNIFPKIMKDSVWAVLKNNSILPKGEKIQFERYLRKLGITLQKIYKIGVLSKSATKSQIYLAIKNGKFLTTEKFSNYLDKAEIHRQIKNEIGYLYRNDESVIKFSKELLESFIQPNIIFDEDYTKKEIEIAKSKVPRNLGIVTENERIISKHDRVTQEIKLKIDSYKIAKAQTVSTIDELLQYLGKSLHLLIILTLYFIYIFLSRNKIFNDNQDLLVIAIIILFTSSLAYLVQFVKVEVPVDYFVLVPLGSMLLAILFDSRLALFGTVTIAFIVGGIRGNDYVITLSHIIAGGFGAFAVRDLRNRNEIFRAFISILVGYIISIIAFGLEGYRSLNEIVIDIAFAGTNALISPVLTFGFIYFFERVFKMSTSLTYLELSDFNNPLLRELTFKAPGTFNHSLVIGTMVEESANLIGANSILARVGAYYHDIGKIYYPDAFVENQFDNKNIHDGLPYKESAKIIIQHVEKGIQLAKEHKIPEEIINFIPTHHGTLLVSYFYEKEKEVNPNTSEEDFRYNGPKPNSKETALLMLADACESAARAMETIEQKKIENLVNNLIDFRIKDGQLDESNITFNDLKIIRTTFVRVLTNQHHKRIRYPNQDEIENNSEIATKEE